MKPPTSATPFEPGHASQQFYKFLKESAKAKGDFVSYKDIREATGYDPQERRGPLMTARRAMMRDHGLVLDTVERDEQRGLAVLTDPQIIHADTNLLERERRSNRKRGRRLGCVDRAAVERDDLIEMDRCMTNRFIVKLLGSNTGQLKIRAAIGARESLGYLPSGAVLELFK